MYALWSTGIRGPKKQEKQCPTSCCSSEKNQMRICRRIHKLRKMASKLGDTKLLTLHFDDARCSELYYHNLCHANFKRSYEDLEKAANTANSGDRCVLEEFVAISAVKDYVDSSNADSFPLTDLEAISSEN